MTLLVAGHETTASTLAWALAALARHPEVVDRLTAEIRAGESEEYLTATIQETLRCRPVLPNVAPRLVMEPIEVGGWPYPAGVCLVPNAYLVHHDPALYEDPCAFRPERFIERPPGTYTWLAFGAAGGAAWGRASRCSSRGWSCEASSRRATSGHRAPVRRSPDGATSRSGPARGRAWCSPPAGRPRR